MFPGAHAAKSPDKPAQIWASTGAITTYAELDAAANRVSRLLREAGVEPGDHVALCLENHPRYLEILWGCHYAGAIYTAVSTRLTGSELEYIVDDCGAKVFITSRYKADQAADVLDATPAVTSRYMLDGTIAGYSAYEDAVAAQEAAPLAGRIAGTDMLYSSGTTGQPKGVALTLAGSPLETTGTSVSGLLMLLFGFSTDSTYLSPAPLYHAAPLRFSMAATALGGTAVVMDHFDPTDFLDHVARYRITHTQVVPTMLIRLLKLPERSRAAADLSSLQYVIHAAAPCPVPVKQQIIEWMGPVVHEYYAGTEGNGFVYCNSEQWIAHPGTVGQAILGTIHIVGEDLEEVPAGESGTVYFESDAVFEYHNDPEKTRQSRHPKGWSTLGDVGYLDEDRFLYLTDRKAYMIISGGVNVYPQEAENTLVTHPKVVDVAVFGVPNDDFGEEVKAVVQPVSMPVSDDEAGALAAELIAFCRSRLADVKCPRTIDFRDELPRHPTGKLYKRLLQNEEYEKRGIAPPWRR